MLKRKKLEFALLPIVELLPLKPLPAPHPAPPVVRKEGPRRMAPAMRKENERGTTPAAGRRRGPVAPTVRKEGMAAHALRKEGDDAGCCSRGRGGVRCRRP
nr:unnamed protein product [Digitaria exilis]